MKPCRREVLADSSCAIAQEAVEVAEVPAVLDGCAGTSRSFSARVLGMVWVCWLCRYAAQFQCTSARDGLGLFVVQGRRAVSVHECSGWSGRVCCAGTPRSFSA